MSDVEEWSFPESLQAEPDDVSVDLDMVLNAVVSVRTEIPDDAFTASILGTERVGNGVVIDDNGVVLTIGYLITEAETIWLTTNDGSVVPGYPLGYDQATGFGLIQPLGQLDAPKIERGSARNCNPGDSVLFVGQGGRQHALKANLVDKREFAEAEAINNPLHFEFEFLVESVVVTIAGGSIAPHSLRIPFSASRVLRAMSPCRS